MRPRGMCSIFEIKYKWMERREEFKMKIKIN